MASTTVKTTVSPSTSACDPSSPLHYPLAFVNIPSLIVIVILVLVLVDPLRRLSAQIDLCERNVCCTWDDLIRRATPGPIVKDINQCGVIDAQRLALQPPKK